MNEHPNELATPPCNLHVARAPKQGAAFWNTLRRTAALAALLLFPRADGFAQTAQPGVLKSEFLFDQASFRSCHASTICEVDGALLAAWFGGSEEGALDVAIWFSRNDGQGWSEPVELANGRNDDDRIHYPCWNPVLFQPRNGPLVLFYKVGPSPSTWWGMMKTSGDGGKSWSTARRLPKDILGPVRNKPIELDDGTMLCGSSTEDSGWRVHIERTRSAGRSWSRTPSLNSALDYGAIQPTLLKWKDGKIEMLCRTKQGRIVDSWSNDFGQTWSRFYSAGLPNPNSGIDAVMLRDERALLVYNHAESGRGLLNVAMTRDGRHWQAAAVLENDPGKEFSYPAVIQSRDGYVHITYTWHRERIKHVVLDPTKLDLRDIVDGQWR